MEGLLILGLFKLFRFLELLGTLFPNREKLAFYFFLF